MVRLSSAEPIVWRSRRVAPWREGFSSQEAKPPNVRLGTAARTGVRGWGQPRHGWSQMAKLQGDRLFIALRVDRWSGEENSWLPPEESTGRLR